MIVGAYLTEKKKLLQYLCYGMNEIIISTGCTAIKTSAKLNLTDINKIFFYAQYYLSFCILQSVIFIIST